MQQRRICFVVTEILGLVRNGGIGTAITHMALLLGDQGHSVDIVNCGFSSTVDPEWAAKYRRSGVQVLHLDRSVDVSPPYAADSYRCYQFLKHGGYDVVVFQDWRGLGAVSVLAKRAGLAFADTNLVHHVHGPTEWLLDANHSIEFDVEAAAVAHMERLSAEHADWIVGPSAHLVDWMGEHGWNRADRRTIIPYFTAGQVSRLDAPLAPARPGGSLRELVFFGRLEERKGVRTLVGALERLDRDLVRGLEVSFLGRPAHFQPDDVRAMFSAELLEALGEVRFHTDFDQPQARAYLAEPGRVAIMPSHLDNSPNVIYECIEDRIPFLASRAGGSGELVAEADRAAVLFDPTPGSLAGLLAGYLGDRTMPEPARPSFDGPTSMERWLEVFEPLTAAPASDERPLVTVVIPHHDRPDLLRQAVESIQRQSYPNIEVLIVDDGSTTRRAADTLDRIEATTHRFPTRVLRTENRYLGAARNAGCAAANGTFVAFLDDDDVVDADYVASLMTAQQRTGADAVSCAFEMLDGTYEGPPRPQDVTGVWVFFGGPLHLGAAINGFGGAGLLVRTEVVARVGGFHEHAGVGHEDWQFYVKVLLGGGTVATVPEPLYRYRVRPSSMIRSTSLYRNSKVVNDAFGAGLPQGMAMWPLLTRGLHHRIAQLEAERDGLHGEVHRLHVELDLRTRYLAMTRSVDHGR